MISLRTFLNELAAAGRRSVRRPGRVGVSLLIVTLGVASASTVWSLLQLVLFRPLPFPHATRLVSVYGVRQKERNEPATAAHWNRRMLPWQTWQQLAKFPTFDGVGAWAPVQLLVGDPVDTSVTGWYASSSLLRLLTTGPLIGRTLSYEDDLAPTSEIVLVSHEAWRARHGARADIVGTKVTFTGQANEREVRTIAGVLPAGLRLRDSAPDYVFPIGPRGPTARRQGVLVFIVGRLADGARLKAATVAVTSLLAESPPSMRDLEGRAISLWEDMIAPAAPPVWLLIATAIAVFVVAAGSATAYSVSEGITRRQETAIRLALGASPTSLRGQILAEKLLHIAIAGPVGYLLAVGLLQGIVLAAPTELSAAVALRGSLERSGFWGALLMATAVMLLPAMAISRRGHLDVPLAIRSRSSVDSANWLETIAVLQLGFAIVLVVVANLLGATFGRLTARPVGFEAENLAVISLRVSEFPRPEQVDGQLGMFSTWRHTDGVVKAIEGVPGVISAAGANAAPFAGSWPTTRVTSEESPHIGELNLQIQVVTSTYFDVMGLPMIHGRMFDVSDRQVGPEQVEVGAIASAELARLLGGTAIGQRVKSLATDRTYHLIGIVGNVKQRSLADQDIPTLYLLSSQYSAIHDIVFRYSGNLSTLLPIVVGAIKGHDRSIVVGRTVAMSDLVARATAPERFRAVLASGFAGVTLLLAMLGAYAVATRVVASQRRDISIRIALGATRSRIVLSVMTTGLRVIGFSLAVGVPGALISALMLRSMLFGVSVELGPPLLAILAVTMVFGAVFMIPALRMTRRNQFDCLHS